MMPKRIYWNRYKDPFPKGTKKIDRSTRWGNIFKMQGRDILVLSSDGETWEYVESASCNSVARERVIAYYKLWICGKLVDKDYNILDCPFTLKDIREELRGYNLACSCKESDSCHGDILLEIANSNKELGYFTMKGSTHNFVENGKPKKEIQFS